MVQINFDKPVMWRPSNALGVAVHLSGTIDDELLDTTLYWSGMMLTFHEELDEEAIMTLAENFQKSFTPRDEQAKLHFEYDGEKFLAITDPHWVPGVKTF